MAGVFARGVRELGEELGTAAVILRLGADVLLEGGQQPEHLERRPPLHLGVGRVIELAFAEVLAPVHRDDGAITWLDSSQSDVQVLSGSSRWHLVGNSLDRSVLRLLVDRRDDPQAATVDVALGQLKRARELLLDLIDEVTDRSALAGPGRLGDRGKRGLGSLLRSEPTLVHHPVQHVLDALLGVGRLLGTQSRVIEPRTSDDGGEQRTLRDGQPGDVATEVGLGGGLDAVGAAAVVDRVEVVLQDCLLGLLPVDLDRDDELFGLAGDRPVKSQEVVLDVLLSDRGPALGRPAPDCHHD